MFKDNPPQDNTAQEKMIAKCLGSLGIRFEKQVQFKNYIVDFFLPDSGIVIEADGPYGHLKKGDKKRDNNLKEMGISEVYHIKSHDEWEIKQKMLELFRE